MHVVAGACGSGLTTERSVHSRTPVLLRFSVSLPCVTATGRWRERGRMRRRSRRVLSGLQRPGALSYNPPTPLRKWVSPLAPGSAPTKSCPPWRWRDKSRSFCLQQSAPPRGGNCPSTIPTEMFFKWAVRRNPETTGLSASAQPLPEQPCGLVERSAADRQIPREYEVPPSL